MFNFISLLIHLNLSNYSQPTVGPLSKTLKANRLPWKQFGSESSKLEGLMTEFHLSLLRNHKAKHAPSTSVLSDLLSDKESDWFCV